MPIFNYRCKDCQEEFEYFIVRSDDHPSCPNCSSTNLKKLVNSFLVGKAQPKNVPILKEKSSQQNSKHIRGCARHYAKKILDNYK